MSHYAATVINAIPNIEKKTYLELGTAWGKTYCQIRAIDKTGVDILPVYELHQDYVQSEKWITADRCSPWQPKNGPASNADMESRRHVLDVKSPASHIMTTDEFFDQNKRKFDVIFIDACHEYAYVRRDFLNALKVLNPGGHIVIHDLVPKDAFHATDDPGSWNGSGYRLLAHLVQNAYPHITHHNDFGLTVFPNAQPIDVPDAVAGITYEEFLAILPRVNMKSHEEVLAHVATL